MERINPFHYVLNRLMPDFFNSFKCSSYSDASVVKCLAVIIGMYLISTHISKYVLYYQCTWHETPSSYLPSNFSITFIITNTKT